MKPVTPEPRGRAVVFAKDQPQYLPLPANVLGDTVETKWRLTWGERFKVLFGRCLYLSVMNFGQPLQPVKPTIGRDA